MLATGDMFQSFSEAWVQYGSWVLGLGLFIASSLGFLAGYFSAASKQSAAEHRVQSGLTALYSRLIHSLESAEDACTLLNGIGQKVLTIDQAATLQSRQSGLLESLKRLVEGTGKPEPVTIADGAGKKSRAARPARINWTEEPRDLASGVPTRPAFQANLQTLLELTTKCEAHSAVLFIQIDKFRSLEERLGAARVEKLTRKFALLTCRSVRDTDFVARWTSDTWAVLLPFVEPAQAEALVCQLRNKIRGYRFRIEDQGPEVYVSASLGLALLAPGESLELALDQAGDALIRAARRGRNQVYVQAAPGLATLAS